MTITIPDELVAAIEELAKRNRITKDEAVRQAIVWFIKEDVQFWNDFRSFETASSEALALVERLASEEEMR